MKWAEKAGARSVSSPTRKPKWALGAETFGLPYHVCLSELLYGEPLYRQRRVMWHLPLPGYARAAATTVA